VVRKKGPFIAGLVLTLGFVVILSVLCFPVFGGRTGLDVADGLFNSVAKASAYFIPSLQKSAAKFAGQSFDVTLDMKAPEAAAKSAQLLTAAGARVTVEETRVTITGDLGRVVKAALDDADAMFHNQGAVLRMKYRWDDEREVLYYWWLTFSRAEAAFKKEARFDAAELMSKVLSKGLEPAYNFYGIEARRIGEAGLSVTGWLVFYVLYTLWWGYAIYFLMEGLGVATTKAKEKKEA